MECQTRARFNETWKIIVAGKRRGNKASLTNEEYQDRLNQLRRLKEDLERDDDMIISPNNQRLIINYDVKIEGGREWLVRPIRGVPPAEFPLYVTNDELFDVLHEAHLETNHGTEEQMLDKIRFKYCNVTREAVVTYLELCPHCFNPRQDLHEVEESAFAPIAPIVPIVPIAPIAPVLAPMPSLSMHNGKSVYFGLINMQHWARDGFSCIMVHWEDRTQLVHALPLQSTSYVHVAIGLLEIYASFGMPYYLDAPYDISYLISVIEYIKSVWRCGVPIKLRSRNDINDTIKGCDLVNAIMGPWLNDERFLSNWPMELKYSQFLMNNTPSLGKNFTLYLRCQ